MKKKKQKKHREERISESGQTANQDTVKGRFSFFFLLSGCEQGSGRDIGWLGSPMERGRRKTALGQLVSITMHI
jgi:hypothetical protein